MPETKLKPCPFCGGPAHMRMEPDIDGVRWDFIVCDDCGARTRGKWVSHSSNTCPLYYAGVRDEWNRRPSPPLSEDKSEDICCNGLSPEDCARVPSRHCDGLSEDKSDG